MVPDVPRSVAVALVAVVAAFVLAAAVPASALPLVQDSTGPTEIEVVSLERLETGCEEEIADAGLTRNGPNGTYTVVSFVETGSRDAALSAWAERTSPTGADFSTFDVHVDGHREGPTNTTCTVGVQYRLTVRTTGGTDPGLLDDPSGTGVRFHENGEYATCASSGSGGFGSACRGVGGPPPRTWANATG